MPVDAPKIDSRDQTTLVEQIQNLAFGYCSSKYLPETWKDISSIQSDKQADTLIRIFARMMETVINRLNKVPDKNFLTFLDLIGVTLFPPRVARAPLTFSMASGASQYGYIPTGTQVATTETKGQEAVVFETERALTVILPKLIKAVSHSPVDDKWTDHSQALFDNIGEYVKLFKGETLIPHRLYLGHSKLFSFQEDAVITLETNIANETEVSTDLNTYDKWVINWYYLDENLVQRPLEIENTNTSDPSDPNNIDLDVAYLLKSGSITFKPVAGIPKVELTGVEQVNNRKNSGNSNWIFAELSTPISAGIPEKNLPKISSVNAKVDVISKSDIAPDLAFFNNFPLDLSKDFYPFGERPKFNDTFYIGSKEVFSKKDAIISLSIILSTGVEAPPADEKRKLSYESWNGSYWEAFNVVTETDKPIDSYDFTGGKGEKKTVTFTCPKIEEKEVNGEKNLWIRVRIIEGNYGDEARYESSTDSNKIGWEYVHATYKPPSISKLSLRYSFSTNDTPEVTLAYNNFAYQNSELPFSPFQPEADKQSVLYLAFDRDISTLPVTIFFPLIGNAISTNSNTASPDSPFLTWQYWSGTEWLKLKIEDNTNNLTKKELIQFLAPKGVANRSCFGFESEHYWIRAVLEKGEYDNFPSLNAIFTNTVWAHNMVTIKDEILGFSNGTPDQIFKFSRSPVLSGQKVLVRELSLSEEDRKTIISEEGEDAIEEISDDAGNITGFWVRWHETKNFYFSNSNSRHYTADLNNGTITFGNGERGMVPPAGKDNIKCSYQSGGGVKGNVQAGTITKLRTTFPYIDSVTNPEAAAGGGDKESLDRVRERGPQTLKHRDRAVTYEDFEWLAKEASPEVAKVKCLPTRDFKMQMKPGCITLIIVPESDDPKPLPDQQLVNEIKEYLFERTSSHLTTDSSQINLIGPGYVQIGVEASVEFTSVSEAKIIEGRILDNLQQFFHPLHGGPEKKGWDFGRSVYISEVYSLIENTDGVDNVDDLTLNVSVLDDLLECETEETVQIQACSIIATPCIRPYTKTDQSENFLSAKSVKMKNAKLGDFITIDENYLICSGAHTINYE